MAPRSRNMLTVTHHLKSHTVSVPSGHILEAANYRSGHILWPACSSMLTVCSAVQRSAVEVRLADAKESKLLGFATCHELAVRPNSTSTLLLNSSQRVESSANIYIFSQRQRNYAVVYEQGAQLALLAPSSLFNETFSADWNRFVWANVCSSCGPVSAYVNSYKKKINLGGRKIGCCGSAVDETEGPPGPPKGAAGVFTAFTSAGAAPGHVVAPVCFPWSRDQYVSREPLQLLIAPNLSMSLLVGFEPVIFNASAPGFSCGGAAPPAPVLLPSHSANISAAWRRISGGGNYMQSYSRHNRV